MISIFPRSAIKEPPAGEVLIQLLREKRRRERKKRKKRALEEVQNETIQTFEALEKAAESIRLETPLPELPQIPLIDWNRALQLLTELIRFERLRRDEADLLELLAICDSAGELD